MQENLNNIIELTDSYKITHHCQYPPGTRNIHSYLESRGGLFPITTFFGLQYIMKKYLQGQVVSSEKISAAKELFTPHFFGNSKLFNEVGWHLMMARHAGRLPVSIKAVPEGTRVNTHNVLVNIEATDPDFYWLPNYLETLLVQLWYPITVASLSGRIREIIKLALETSGDVDGLCFKLHDFGFRGVSSVESAMIGGMAHLVNFMGTDTVIALRGAKEYYSCPCAGHSIPAAEHSTITSWFRNMEKEAYENMLTQYPTGFVAVVSDSYDIYNACEKIWGEELRDRVLSRDGVLVIRPDSGIPVDVILKILPILATKFGYTINDKGYKVLNPKVRVIQGDGVNANSISEILGEMLKAKWSADNIAFGMGGALLQGVNRDTNKFAFKCSAREDEKGVWHDVYKQPVTDSGKVSKKGRLKLIKESSGMYTTIPMNVPTAQEDLLVEVFRDGEILKEYTFDEIRKNAA